MLFFSQLVVELTTFHILDDSSVEAASHNQRSVHVPLKTQTAYVGKTSITKIIISPHVVMPNKLRHPGSLALESTFQEAISLRHHLSNSF